jgi:hypothetical protein
MMYGGNRRDQRDHDAAGEDVAEESQRQRDRLGDLLDEVDRRQEGDVALEQLDRMTITTAAPDARRVEQRKTNRASASTKLMSEHGGLSSSWVPPSASAVLDGEH